MTNTEGKYYIIKLQGDNRTKEQQIFDAQIDYHGDTSLYLESVCQKVYEVPTEYRHCARKFKTREQAQKMIDKLITFNGKALKVEYPDVDIIECIGGNNMNRTDTNDRQRKHYRQILNLIDNNIIRCIENLEKLSAGDMDQIDSEEWVRLATMSDTLAEAIEANTY